MSKLEFLTSCLLRELQNIDDTYRYVILPQHRTFFSYVTNDGVIGYEVNPEIVIRHTTKGQVMVIVGQYPKSRIFTLVPACVVDGESLARYIVNQLVGAWKEWKKNKNQKTPYEKALEEGLCG